MDSQGIKAEASLKTALHYFWQRIVVLMTSLQTLGQMFKEADSKAMAARAREGTLAGVVRAPRVVE